MYCEFISKKAVHIGDHIQETNGLLKNWCVGMHALPELGATSLHYLKYFLMIINPCQVPNHFPGNSIQISDSEAWEPPSCWGYEEGPELSDSTHALHVK